MMLKIIRSQVTVSDGKVEKNYVEEYSHEEFGEIELQNIPRVKKLSGPQLVCLDRDTSCNPAR